MTTVVRWKPLREMMNLRNEMDRMFDEALNEPRLRWQNATNWGLALDVAEQDDTFIIKASVPGVQPDDLDITISDNVLTIKGELLEDQTIDQETYHLRERRFGSFSRSVTLPVPVNSDEIEAVYEHGVLTLQVPKAEELKPRRIAIKTSDGHKTLASAN